MKRSYNTDENEPEQNSFVKPSEKEHLFQVVEVYDENNAPGKMVLDNNTVCAKIEVCGGEEQGRTMLNRLNLDQNWKGFYFTRLFLKAIGEPYKGAFDIDIERWIGRQFYASVVHNDGYANIAEYNFDKKIAQKAPQIKNPDGAIDPNDIQWTD